MPAVVAPGLLAAFDIINTLLPAIQTAIASGQDIPVSTLQDASTRLHGKIDAFQAKLDADKPE